MFSYSENQFMYIGPAGLEGFLSHRFTEVFMIGLA